MSSFGVIDIENDDEAGPPQPYTWAIAAIELVVVLLIVSGVAYWWPEVFPINLTDPLFWDLRGDFGEWMAAAWPMLLWGCVGTIILQLIKRKFISPQSWAGDLLNRLLPSPGVILVEGAKISVRAGVTEELIFRWARWILAILGCLIVAWAWVFFAWVMIAVAVFLLFIGFNKGGLNLALALLYLVLFGACLFYDIGPEWIHLNISGPVADFFTLGYLHDYLFHPSSWMVGAAMLISNSKFRDGHKHLGTIGVGNSWILGMFLFWVLIQFGLVAAIVVHILYDLVVFSTLAGMRAVGR